MAVSSLSRALRTLSLSSQVLGQAVHRTTHSVLMTLQSPVTVLGTSPPLCRGFLTTATLDQNRRDWKETQRAGKYTVKPMGLKKSGGRDQISDRQQWVEPSPKNVVSDCDTSRGRNLHSKIFLEALSLRQTELLGTSLIAAPGCVTKITYCWLSDYQTKQKGRIRTHGIGGGHKQLYRWVDIHRFPLEPEKDKPAFEEKVVEVRYDPCRSADIALVAGGEKKRWIIATESMQVGDIIKTSSVIGRMAVSANEGDAHPLGALPVGTLVNCLEIAPGRGAKYIRAAGTCGVLLRKVNGTAIVQLPSKRQVQVLETCMVTVGRVSNIDHNMRVIGKAGRNRWLGIRPSSGLWQRKGGWAGRKIKPLPPMKNYLNMPSFAAAAAK